MPLQELLPMDPTGPIIEIFKCAYPILRKYVRYHRTLDKKMNDLKRDLQELNSKKKDIEARLSWAEREQGKKPSNEVNDWLQNVQRITSDGEIIELKVKKSKFFSRACLGRLVEKKIQEVEKYRQSGRSFAAENLVSDAPPTSGRMLDEKMNDLKRVLQELNNQKKDVEARLKMECDQRNKQPSNEVNDWLKNIERINREAESVIKDQQEVKKGKYFARARLGKDVEERIQEVERYHQKGCSFTSLVIVTPPTSRMMLPTTETLAGEKTEKIVQEIWEDLMGDKVSKIGVWGMGGVGKTTIMIEINNRLCEKANKFDDVIWVTVSQPLVLNKLQNEIATALNQSLRDTEDKVRRAGMLLGMLKAKERFVLILDDMWEAFPLADVGIPEPSEENGCKLVITTRSLEVCHSMGCKKVRVQPLSQEEALNLFLDKVGIESNLQVQTSAKTITAVVKESAGLPLAVVTVAASMKGEYEIPEWRNALNELCTLVRSMKGVDTAVFGRLEFSYHRLKDEKVQQCFLYCAMYPEDCAISKDELIDYWIAEGFIEEVKDVQAKYDRGHTILNRLVSCCLLERAEDGGWLKMHDLIRDMALRIIREIPSSMVQAGVRLVEFPGEQEWKDNLERVSLMGNNIHEIPSKMSPHCPILSTLLLQQNGRLMWIPECFFEHMHGLKILNLSSTSIEVLPNSVSDLTNLRSLLLRRCRMLKRVPSLAKLSVLQYLDLDSTRIEEVPDGMEMLENLSHLYLLSWRLTRFPTGILPGLRNLYKLKLNFGTDTLPETVEEAGRLSNRMDTFEGHFNKHNDFNVYVKSSDGRGSKNYRLQLTTGGYTGFVPDFSKEREAYKPDKSVTVKDCKICEIRAEPIVLRLPGDVQRLKMEGVDVTSLNDVLPREHGLVDVGKFSRDLKVLEFFDCPKLRKMFSLQLLPALQNLECLQVGYCNTIEEIVAVDGEEAEKELGTNAIITLPRLKKLLFRCLPVFESVCGGNAVLVCNSLQQIEVSNCPELKRLSLRLPLSDNGRPSPPPRLNLFR